MDKLDLKKLAKELNLSPSSVSRALRDSHEISSETKERVKALAAKWGYQPNPHASSLRQSKSKAIAVIVPEIQNNFFAQVINGVEEVAKEKGYHVLIYLTHEDNLRENEILNLLRNGRVDGIMISVSNTTTDFEHLEACRISGMPLVFFDRVYENIKVPRITSDDEEASFKATEVLIKRGCKKIAFLTLSDNLSICKRRNSGYERALAKHHMLDMKHTVECGMDDELNREKIRELLRGDQKPDGIFAAIEKFAVNTYEVCKELHVVIPTQLKVISFSNLSAAALFDPPLSAIVQPAYEIGKKSTDVLFKIIEKKVLLPNDKKISISSTIIERKSTSK
ncbi:LacI family DNA-binding transcriptional regulator [Lacibacter sp.]|uniref:LacI family DNA-binding transcriptional regulator n=1 Tax=Lacibacter sp. TaxID=1915409 RepID=UPI002B4AB718|nr:LacI family DNA-binding transcriptional regulator [Lacibacter sp.]HLP36329.1 LacI family DNA-binding transcriptional regulator [Lacibacter sp.]